MLNKPNLNCIEHTHVLATLPPFLPERVTIDSKIVVFSSNHTSHLSAGRVHDFQMLCPNLNSQDQQWQQTLTPSLRTVQKLKSDLLSACVGVAAFVEFLVVNVRQHTGWLEKKQTEMILVNTYHRCWPNDVFGLVKDTEARLGLSRLIQSLLTMCWWWWVILNRFATLIRDHLNSMALILSQFPGSKLHFCFFKHSFDLRSLQTLFIVMHDKFLDLFLFSAVCSCTHTYTLLGPRSHKIYDSKTNMQIFPCCLKNHKYLYLCILLYISHLSMRLERFDLECLEILPKHECIWNFQAGFTENCCVFPCCTLMQWKQKMLR